VTEGKNPRWVDAHGKKILVSTLPYPDKKSRRRRRLDGAYSQVDLAWAARAARARRSPTAFMIVYLQYAAWKAKSATFSLPNTDLKIFGISRKAKYRILRAFAADGLIRVDHNGRQAPTITLL
jgi:hypothetical protein